MKTVKIVGYWGNKRTLMREIKVGGGGLTLVKGFCEMPAAIKDEAGWRQQQQQQKQEV